MTSWTCTVGYINNHVYLWSYFRYWFDRMVAAMPDPKGRIDWEDPKNFKAKQCYEQVIWLLQHMPTFYHPTRQGQFCLQTDASKYASGAVLFQKQYDEEKEREEWHLIDMWSKILPKDLRSSHSITQEGYAIVAAVEHWQFYLT